MEGVKTESHLEGCCSKITFVGTGCSTAVPVMGHVGDTCACGDAVSSPGGPNARNNVSLLISVSRHDASRVETVKHVLIDVGKTFRDAYFRILAPRVIRDIGALFITHDHADAMQGIDDVMYLQPMKQLEEGQWIVEKYLPTYLLSATIATLEVAQNGLLANSRKLGPAPKTLTDVKDAPHRVNIGEVRTAALDFYTLPDDSPTPFFVEALGESFPMYSLPVWHGIGYISLGFVFGPGVRFLKEDESENIPDASNSNECGRHASSEKRSGLCVVYLSDVSDVPPASMKFLNSLERIDILVVDCVAAKGFVSAPHFAWDEMWAFVCKVQPVRTFCVGLYCTLEHYACNDVLQRDVAVAKENGILGSHVESVEMAFDGLELSLD